MSRNRFRLLPKHECNQARAGQPIGFMSESPREVEATKRRRCRDCGKRVELGEAVLVVVWNFGESQRYERAMYLHKEDCNPERLDRWIDYF